MPSNGSDFWLKGKVKKSLPQKIKNISLNIKRDAIQCSKRSWFVKY